MNLSKTFKQFLRISNIKWKHNFFSTLNSNCISNNLPDTSSNEDKKQIFFNSIFNRILLETREYYVIDKPAGVSLFRKTPNDPNYISRCSEFAVQDILPELCLKLKRHEDSLVISTELPWAFSGLFVLSKSSKHAEVCKNFYKNSSMGKNPGYINQSYRCLCWNRPKVLSNNPKAFHYSFYQFDPDDPSSRISHISDPPTQKEKNKKIKWSKHIGHDVVAFGNKQNDNVCLIDVKCNSTYRGVVELYLLHQGCIVVGEYFQASRLVTGGVNGDIFILPPEKANPSKPLPIQFRQRLGVFVRDLRILPLHIHCNQLLIPSSNRKPKNESYLCSKEYNFNSNSSVVINWDRELKLSVCSYDSLPDYYTAIMNQLNINLPLS